MADRTVERTWLTPKEAAAYLRMSERTLEGWRRAGRGPQFARPGGKLVRYRFSDLERWLREERGPSAENAPGPVSGLATIRGSAPQ